MGFLSTPHLTPREDGWLCGQTLHLFAIMAARLQATLEGNSLSLSLWGGGDLARIALTHDWQGPFAYGPNILTCDSGGLWVAQSQPVILLRHARTSRVTPARTAARWASSMPARALKHRHAEGDHSYPLPWGTLRLQQRGDDLVIAAGCDEVECASALAMGNEAIIAEATSYAAQCDRMPQAPALLRSMVLAGIHTALASRRRLSDGRFGGLAAGMNYTAPSRTYYRDGYWTLQALLHADPDSVAAQIDLLAQGIHADGEAPSAVITADAAQLQVWETFRLANPKECAAHTRSGEWWSDHTDSPLFFVLALDDYCRTVGSNDLFARYLPQVRAIYARYKALAQSGDGLPVKPRHDRDWADNVFRSGHVSYISGLWLGALSAIAQRLAEVDEPLAHDATQLHAQARGAVVRLLMTAQGWPCNYRDTGRALSEDHLSLDCLTLVDGGAFDHTQTAALLDQVATQLETRNNQKQPHGDWGVMCAWPPYSTRGDLRGKTTFAYRYHNGSDWPWLDGLYARARLRTGLDGWQYPLLHWWEYGLSQGWTSPVEYFSPPYGRGSLLQGWSSMAAAVALDHSATVLADYNSK